MIADNIKCNNCGYNGLVPMSASICPKCKKHGTLAWKEGEQEEIEVSDDYFETINNINNKHMKTTKYYTKKQLQTLTKFKNKFIDASLLHHEYWNAKDYKYETVYIINGISNTEKENYETIEEILKR